MLGRALRPWQLKERPLDRGVAKVELEDAAAVSLAHSAACTALAQQNRSNAGGAAVN